MLLYFYTEVFSTVELSKGLSPFNHVFPLNNLYAYSFNYYHYPDDS